MPPDPEQNWILGARTSYYLCSNQARFKPLLFLSLSPLLSLRNPMRSRDLDLYPSAAPPPGANELSPADPSVKGPTFHSRK